jgi:hypothetical protein
MADIVDLEGKRSERDVNPRLVYIDADGTRWYKFGVDYTWETPERTSSFVVYLFATSAAEAEKRLEALKRTGRMVGMVCEEIEA